MPAKYVLGLYTLQMNKDYDYGNSVVANQLQMLENLGIFKKPLPKFPAEQPHLSITAMNPSRSRAGPVVPPVELRTAT